MHNSSILPWAAMRTNEATYVEHFCICKGQPFLPTTTSASSTAPGEAAERVKPSAWNTTSDPYNQPRSLGMLYNVSEPSSPPLGKKTS